MLHQHASGIQVTRPLRTAWGTGSRSWWCLLCPVLLIQTVTFKKKILNRKWNQKGIWKQNSQSKVLLMKYSFPHNCFPRIIRKNIIRCSWQNMSPFMSEVDRAKKKQKKPWINWGGKILKGRTAVSRQSIQNYTAAYSQLQWMDLW